MWLREELGIGFVVLEVISMLVLIFTHKFKALSLSKYNSCVEGEVKRAKDITLGNCQQLGSRKGIETQTVREWQ